MSEPGKRRGARVQMRFHALFSDDKAGGPAILAEISSSGARLQSPEPWPAIGLPVALYVWLPNQAEPSEITGNVVRHTADGFAMEFEKPGQETCLLADAVAQLACDVPGPSKVSPVPATRAPAAPPLTSLDLSGYPLIDLEHHAERVAAAIATLRERRKS